MKKALLAIAVLGALSGGAQAQSNVTIYGLVEAGVRYSNNINGLSKTELAGGPSQVGFRGKEDLGGGMSAIFVVENGFLIDTGMLAQNGRMFGRQAFVGLQANDIGTFTMGRQYDSVVNFLQPVSAGANLWAGSLGAHFGDIDNVNNSFRLSNAIKYTSPNFFNGLTFGGLYSFGETAGQPAQNSAVSLGASYVSGPWNLAAAYMNVKNPIVAAYDGDPTTHSINGIFGSGSPYAGLQFADALKVLGVGGAYEFNKTRIGLLYVDSKLPNSFLAKGDAEYQNLEANAQYSVTQALKLGIAYNYTLGHWSSSDTHPKYGQINAGADYTMSKRTHVYIQYAYQKAAGDAKFAQINLLSASNTRTQFTTQIGIRHYF